MELPVSYEVAREMLEAAETAEEIREAIRLCAEALVRETFAVYGD